MYLVFYEKRNGDIIYKIRNTIPNSYIGETTSMGWRVIDIKQKYKNGYYDISKCNKLFSKQFARNKKKRNLIKYFKLKFNKLLQLSTIIIVVYLFQLI